MTFETLDWKAEAERIRLAFDLKCECEFVGSDNSLKQLMYRLGNGASLNHSTELHVDCVYGTGVGRNYCIYSEEKGVTVTATQINFSWENDLPYRDMYGINDFTFSEVLAKGIFHLGLLSPEAEAELRVSISAHQKLEWELEYQKRTQR